MARVLGATCTTEDVLSGVNLSGKRILVTGVSAGLGVETARSLAAHGVQRLLRSACDQSNHQACAPSLIPTVS